MTKIAEWQMWKIIAWECGLCGKTNEDMAHRHCQICGIPRPVCYYVVAGPIKPESGRRWFGRAANPINEEDLNADGKVPSPRNSTDPSPALSSITTVASLSDNNNEDLNNGNNNEEESSKSRVD
jgi:hypothetical protein